MHIKLQGSHSVPLGIAAENGQAETAKILIEAGAIVNYQNKVNITLSSSHSLKHTQETVT